MSTYTPEVPVPPRPMIRRVALATLAGTTVEWYDFFVYGAAAALVLNKLFFPSFSPVTGTLLSFATFATGWLARPVGGVIAGHFGDRIGRKSMLIATLVLMGVATTLVGVLPTFATVGVWAPVLLVTLRVVQGFAVGGEYGGAVVMAVEHAPDGKRGFYGSWPQTGVPLGLVLGTAVFYPFTLLPDAQFLAWGWRIPFLISFVLVGIGLVIRLRVFESPAFTRAKDAKDVARAPLVAVMRHHPKRVLLLIGAHIAPNTYFYTFATFILAYATTTLGFTKGTVLVAVSAAAIVEVITMPLFAALSDRVGRRRVYIGGLAYLGLLTVPFFLLLRQGSAPLLFVALAVTLGIGHSAVYGTQASFFAELFPTRVRYTGLSLGYQVAGAIFGGPLPIIATALIAWNSGEPWIFAGYMVLTAVVSSVAAALAPDNTRDPIDGTDPVPGRAASPAGLAPTN